MLDLYRLIAVVAVVFLVVRTAPRNWVTAHDRDDSASDGGSCGGTRVDQSWSAPEVAAARTPSVTKPHRPIDGTAMTNPGDDLVTVELAAGLWSCIDANTDNVVSLAVVDGPEADVEIGDAIRDAGAAQVPWVEGQWPPRDQEIAVTLSEGQWRWALHHLEEHARSYERIGDQESLALGRAAATAIRRGLGESATPI